MQPLKKLTSTAFAAGVLSRAIDTASKEVKGERRAEWIASAKARYLERVEGIPDDAAQECAVSCFNLTCMAGTPGNLYVNHHQLWPDPLKAADDDMARWSTESQE